MSDLIERLRNRLKCFWFGHVCDLYFERDCDGIVPCERCKRQSIGDR